MKRKEKAARKILRRSLLLFWGKNIGVTSNFGEKADRHTTYASGREKMAKTRGAAGPTAGVPARKVSKENLGGVTRVLKAKNINVAAAGAVKKTSKSKYGKH